MPSLYPDPGFDYYYKACKKGDREAIVFIRTLLPTFGPIVKHISASKIFDTGELDGLRSMLFAGQENSIPTISN
jgi:hypothetical protein